MCPRCPRERRLLARADEVIERTGAPLLASQEENEWPREDQTNPFAPPRQDQGEDAAPEESAERKFYMRQLQGIRFSHEEAAQAAKVADSTRPSALQII